MIAVYISLIILYIAIGVGTAKAFADTDGITFWQGVLIIIFWPLVWTVGALQATLT